MDLVAKVDARRVEGVQDRAPAPGQLLETGVDQPGRTLRPRVQERPEQRARERRVRGQAEIAGRPGGEMELVHRPLLARGGIAVGRWRREPVERDVVGRVHGDELALEMGRQLRQFDPGLRERAQHLVAVGPAFRGAGEVEQPRVPARYLHPGVAVPGGPSGDTRERVERCGIARELG